MLHFEPFSPVASTTLPISASRCLGPSWRVSTCNTALKNMLNDWAHLSQGTAQASPQLPLIDRFAKSKL